MTIQEKIVLLNSIEIVDYDFNADGIDHGKTSKIRLYVRRVCKMC